MSTTPLEIEKKFLIGHIPKNMGFEDGGPVSQGYLKVGPELEVRISKREQSDKCYICTKTGAGLVRTEVQTEISKAAMGMLWPLTEGKRIRKSRGRIRINHNVTNKELTVEIDTYLNKALKGVYTAEIEFESEEEANSFVAPAWLGPDITDVLEYKNSYMAVNGKPVGDIYEQI